MTLDWHRDALTSATVIDANYRMTANVRRFFSAQLNAPAHFGRPFLQWMKSHPGRTLGEAVTHLIRQRARAPSRSP